MIMNNKEHMQHNNTNTKKEYIKFFALITAILIVAYCLTLAFLHGDSFIKTYMQHVMGVFFISFAAFQLLGYKSFVGMFADYDPIAKRIKAYSYAYPFIGIGLGLLYLFDIGGIWRDAFTAIIMLVGAYGVWKTIKEKKGQVHCACLGNIIKLPLSTTTLVEDIAMGLMAIVMVAVSLFGVTDTDHHNGGGIGMMGMKGGMGMMMGGYDLGEKFDMYASDAPFVKPTEVVELKDGDIYEMTAGIVQQEVGNRTIKRLAYNQMIPGPTIKVQKGATITLVFKNELDVETTLHSHGLRGKDQFDGVPMSMGGKQKAMQPGETFTYELEFPDTGVFWYHPHIREDYTQEMGLYGNYWVDEKDYWNKVDKEEFIIVDDFSENDPFYKEVANKTMMGRYGNLLMINNDTDYNLQAKTGETIRFYMTNTANTRVFDVAIKNPEGEIMPIKVVGGDIGRVEKEYMADSVIIAPSERYIFESTFNKAGTYTIEHRGKKFGTITITGAETVMQNEIPLRTNPQDYAILRNQFDALLARTPDKTLRFTIGMKGMGEMRRGMRHKNGMGKMMGGEMEDMKHMEEGMGGTMQMHSEDGIEWEDGMAMMNAMSNSERMEWKLVDENTGKINMNIDDWTFKKGDFVKVRLFNDPNSMHPMQHPIHFHGQRFVVIASDWNNNGKMKAKENLQWKDTALIRTGETVDIIIEMTNEGKWMAHCHIAEHLHAGMMMNFVVEK